MNMWHSGKMKRFRRIVAVVALVLFGLSRFEWDGITVKTTADQAKLARIALNAKNIDVRRAAVKKLTGQATLAKVVMDGRESEIRFAAVAKLNDQPLLAKIALEAVDTAPPFNIAPNADNSLRLAAVAKLTDQSALVRIALKSEDRRISYNAMEKITDQETLAAVAIKTMSSDAVERITDQALLAKIILGGRHIEGNSAYGVALAKLTDARFLLKVCMESQWEVIRAAAYDRLAAAHTQVDELSGVDTDLTTRLYASMFLKLYRECQSIPKGDDHSELCARILELFNLLVEPRVRADLGDLEDIHVQWERSRSKEYKVIWSDGRQPVNDEIHIIYKADATISLKLSKMQHAVSRSWYAIFPDKYVLPPSASDMETVDVFRLFCGYLSEPTLEWVAEKFPNQAIRDAAIKEHVRMNGADLAKIIFESKDIGDQRKAVDRLNDQALLAKVAIRKGDSECCKEAVEKLTDQALLGKVAVEADDSMTREVAVWKLWDRAVLAEVAVKDQDEDVRAAAAKKLNDQAVLSKIASEDLSWPVREVANNRLAEVREEKPKEQPQKEKEQTK